MIKKILNDIIDSIFLLLNPTQLGQFNVDLCPKLLCLENSFEEIEMAVEMQKKVLDVYSSLGLKLKLRSFEILAARISNRFDFSLKIRTDFS
jgi:hypothetical protein